MRGLMPLIATGLLAAPAQAADGHIHDILRDRCLAPMEAIQPPDTSGLEQSTDLPGWWTKGDAAAAYEIGDGTHLVVTTGQPLICAVGSTASQSVAQAFVDWHSIQDPNTPYIRLNPTTWESFEWREPRLQLGLGRTEAGAFVYVHETDLEA